MDWIIQSRVKQEFKKNHKYLGLKQLVLLDQHVEELIKTMLQNAQEAPEVKPRKKK